MKIDPTISFSTVLLFSFVMAAIMGGYVVWMRERRDRTIREARAEERETKRLELEERRIQAQEQSQYEADRREEQKMTAERAGVGSGGFIVMDMPEKDRALFHDLLKGFEDYAKLKGYEIAFSIDSSFEGRIAFKFTVKDDGVTVGPERVRKDFGEYVKQVRNGSVEDLDDMPVVTSIEEHNLLVALLKNRIVFLQESYKLAKNAQTYYESILANMRSFPALPAVPSVIVQTGGNMDSRRYNAVGNRNQLGDGNSDSSVNIDIGHSFNERQDRINAIDDVIAKLKAEQQTKSVEQAQRELSKVRDELADDPQPDSSSMYKWMERAKNLMMTAILSYETMEAVKKLLEIFGMK